jgi:acyl-CoA dehydrogenase
MPDETTLITTLELKKQAADFVNRYLLPLENEVEETNQLDPATFKELIKKARSLDLYGFNMTVELGGLGLSLSQQVVIALEMGKVNIALSEAFGYLPELLTNARTDQYDWFVKPLVEGEKLIAYALTEPGGGSDLAATKTRAVKVPGGYRLNGSKTFISGAIHADFIVVMAVTDESATSLHNRFTAFIVEKGVEGLQIGKPMRKMGWRGYNLSELFFDNIFIPQDRVLGEPGNGFNYLLSTVNATRVNLAARYTGTMIRAIDYGCQYALERQTFGKRLADHEVIQFWLADMDVDRECSQLLTEKAARVGDEGNINEFRIAASRAKLFGSEAVGRVTDKLIQIMGGYGYMAEYPAERLYRDARAYRIGEGTSEMQRLQIARNLIKQGEAKLNGAG